MIQAFIEYLSAREALHDSEQEAVRQNCELISLSKGDHLLRAGTISDAFFFNLQGCIRLYYLRNGEETTAFFYQEEMFISAYESYLYQQPALLNFQAMEACELIKISRTAASSLLKSSPKFEFLARLAMETELIAQQRIIANLLRLKPEERFYELMERQPEIFQRVPQRYIASYIGVKPESLSRIKKRHQLRKS
ncbi:MAG: Crp/Fnr family transcriptional regulator [Bacteroidota bacterium]